MSLDLGHQLSCQGTCSCISCSCYWLGFNKCIKFNLKIFHLQNPSLVLFQEWDAQNGLFHLISVPPPCRGSRLLVRRASRRPGTPLERKMDAFGRPNSGEKGKLFSIISLSILIYLKQNSFNFHYYYTLDSLINLMVYLVEWKCHSSQSQEYRVLSLEFFKGKGFWVWNSSGIKSFEFGILQG